MALPGPPSSPSKVGWAPDVIGPPAPGHPESEKPQAAGVWSGIRGFVQRLFGGKKQPSPSPPPPSPAASVASVVIGPIGAQSPGSLFEMIATEPNQSSPGVILSFLTTKDRLRLARCCKSFEAYLRHLDTLSVRATASAKAVKSMQALLPASPAIFSMSITSETAMAQVSEHLPPLLKHLDVRRALITDDGAGLLTHWLRQGQLSHLATLQVSHSSGFPMSTFSYMGLESFRGLFSALANGASPLLEQLQLVQNPALCPMNDWVEAPDGAGKALALAMESGNLKSLLDIQICGVPIGVGGGEALARALQANSCPYVRLLDFTVCFDRNPLECLPLIQALRAGACSHLLSLNLTVLDHGDVIVLPLAEAIQAGGMPVLQDLYLGDSLMSAEGGRAMASAFLAGHHDLQTVKLEAAFRAPEAASHILSALRDRGCPRLKQLELMRNSIMDASLLALAIQGGALRELEILTISGGDGPQHGLHDDGIATVLRALATGACPNLSCLAVDVAGGMEESSFYLSEVLLSRSCPKLQTLCVHNSHRIAPPTLIGVFEALEQGCCPELQELFLRRVRLQSEHEWRLAHALKKRSCPKLRSLWLGHHASALEDYGLVAIADALAAGKCPSLTELHMHMGRGTTASSLLALGLANARLPYLKTLHVSCERTPVRAAHYGVQVILRALSRGTSRPCPHLEDLQVLGSPQAPLPPAPPTSTRRRWAWPWSWSGLRRSSPAAHPST